MGLNSYDDPKVKKLITASLNSVVTPQSYNGLSGRVYCPYQLSVNMSLVNASQLAVNLIRATAFVVSRKVRMLEANLYLVSGGTANVSKFRFGLYRADPTTMYPTERIWQSPEITVTSSNALYQLSNLLLDLEAGIYYVVLLCTTPNNKELVFRGIQPASQQIVLNYSAANQTLPINRIEVAQVYAPAGLPATFPVNGILQTSSFNPEFFTIRSIPVNN